MTGKVQPKERNFQFILNLEPKVELSEGQIAGLFREGIEKIPRTNLYSKRSGNFLEMFLCIDELQNENTSLGLNQLEFTLVKKEMK